MSSRALLDGIKNSRSDESQVRDDDEIPGSPLAQLFQCKLRDDDADILIYAMVELEDRLDKEKLIRICNEKILSLPRFRSIMVKRKNSYYWKRLNALDIELGNHIKEVSVPYSNSESSLLDYSKKLLHQALNFSRPLWEVHVLRSSSSGVGDTIIFRIHHSLGDGVSMASLLLDIIDQGDDNVSASLPMPRKRESKTLFQNFISAIQFSWNTLVTLAHFTCLLFISNPVVGVKVPGSVRHLPRTIATARFSVSDAKSIGRALNATVNDVIVAVTSGAIEKYETLTSTGSKPVRSRPSAHGLVMVSLRPPLTSADFEKMRQGVEIPKWGTIVGYTAQQLPVATVSRPIERLEIVKRNLDRGKHSAEPLITNLIMKVVGICFGALNLLRLMIHIVGQSTVGISNVACPDSEVYFAGNKVKAIYQFVSGVPMGVSFHAIGYAGNLYICVNACEGVVDAEVMAECLRKSFEELKADAEQI